VGSEFEVIPRLDGKGKDIVIIGTIPHPGSKIEKNDSEQSNTLVTLSEVASPASGTLHPLLAGAIVRDKILAHSTSLGAQHPSGGDPSGLQAVGGGDSSEEHADRLDDCMGAVASGIFRHELTHKPTDPHCEACQRGNMRNLRKYAGAFPRPVSVFGDIITMDHCSFYDQGMMYALNGKVVALVVRDVATTFGSVYPSHSKDTEETVAALQHF